MKNIYLIGMMGSGKTSSGRTLAKMLNLVFVDLDEQISRETRETISDIFKTKGETHFRALETKLLGQCSKKSDQVIATGGGIVLSLENNSRMKETGTIIYLKTSPNVLWERVKHNKTRPLLATGDPKKTLEDLLAQRAPLYESVANQIFLTDHKTPDEVAQEIYSTSFAKK